MRPNARPRSATTPYALALVVALMAGLLATGARAAAATVTSGARGGTPLGSGRLHQPNRASAPVIVSALSSISPSTPAPTLAEGYTMVGTDGGIFAFGATKYYGSVPGVNVHVDDVDGIAPTQDQRGYWLIARDGGTFSFGDTHFYGSIPWLGLRLSNIIGMAPTLDSHGYWIVGSDGGVFSFGDAHFHGSLPQLNIHLSNVVGMVTSIDGKGYWMVSSTGGVYSFGDSHFYGSIPGLHISLFDVKGMVATADGKGYWLVTSTGSVYPFGDARYWGDISPSAHVNNVIGLTPTLDGQGYWIVQSNGAVSNFGDAHPIGNLPALGVHVNNIVAASTIAGLYPTPPGSRLVLIGDKSLILPGVGATYVAQPEVVQLSGATELVPRGTVSWSSDNAGQVSAASGVIDTLVPNGSAAISAGLGSISQASLDVIAAVPASNTIIVPSGDVVSRTAGQATVLRDSTTSLIHAGDIAVSGSSGGLLVHVTSVTQAGNDLTLKTSPTSLVAAFPNISVSISTVPTAGSLAGGLAPEAGTVLHGAPVACNTNQPGYEPVTLDQSDLVASVAPSLTSPCTPPEASCSRSGSICAPPSLSALRRDRSAWRGAETSTPRARSTCPRSTSHRPCSSALWGWTRR